MALPNDFTGVARPIQADGLLLRAFEDSDADNFVVAALESLETVGRWMSWCNSAFSRQDALNWFETCRSDLASGVGYEVGIFSAENCELLGGCGLNSVNRQHLFCNLGYWVRQSRQRHGVASQSIRALAPFAFETLGLQRLEIVVACGNMPSEALAQKSGAKLECVARNRLHIHGRSLSASVFSLLPGDLVQLSISNY